MDTCACRSECHDEEGCDSTVGDNPFDVDVRAISQDDENISFVVCDWCDEWCRQFDFGREGISIRE